MAKAKKPTLKKTLKNPAGIKMMKRVPIRLSATELAERGQAAANFAASFDQESDRFNQIKKDWKAKLDDLENKRDINLLAIREGKEERQVEVVMVKNYDQQRVEYYYEGNLVDHREMNADDNQQDLEEQQARASGKKVKSVKDTRKLIEETAAKRDMNGAAMMMPGATPGAKVIDTTESKLASETPAEERENIASVHKMESSRKTKRSSVDAIGSKH
jgi:hypothetical protein